MCQVKELDVKVLEVPSQLENSLFLYFFFFFFLRRDVVQDWVGKKKAKCKSKPHRGSERGLEVMIGQTLRGSRARKDGRLRSHKVGWESFLPAGRASPLQ